MIRQALLAATAGAGTDPDNVQPTRLASLVHLETKTRAELRGVVDVQQRTTPRGEVPVCSGIAVEEICLEP